MHFFLLSCYLCVSRELSKNSNDFHMHHKNRGSSQESIYIIFKQKKNERRIYTLRFRFECLENFPAFFSQQTKLQPSLVMIVSHKHVCRTQILEYNRSPKNILNCWSDGFNLGFFHGKTFNHWKPNQNWNALIFFTSADSSFKLN